MESSSSRSYQILMVSSQDWCRESITTLPNSMPQMAIMQMIEASILRGFDLIVCEMISIDSVLVECDK
jgi:hypothetical protein